MSGLIYNAGSYAVHNQDLDFKTDTMEVILTKRSYMPDHNDDASVYGRAEVKVGGYMRKVLTGKRIENDTRQNRTAYFADNPSTWQLAEGADIGGAIIGKRGPDAVPLFFVRCTGATNGGPYTLTFPPDGIGGSQQ